MMEHKFLIMPSKYNIVLKCYKICIKIYFVVCFTLVMVLHNSYQDV